MSAHEALQLAARSGAKIETDAQPRNFLLLLIIEIIFMYEHMIML
jgi:hypothetical protein